MNDVVEEIVVGKTVAKIYQDLEERGPNEWGDENLFLVAFHRDFSVSREGFSQEVCQMLFEKPSDIYDESIRERVAQIKREYHIFGLEAYIHSGVVLALSHEGNFVDRQWDVSQLGLVFVAKTETRLKTKARKMAQGLIETWNMALSGAVYGYDIEDGDSCWGFYGIEAVREAAKEAAEYAETKRVKDFIERKKTEIKHHVPLNKRGVMV